MHLLDDDPTRAPVEWRIAWTLHGMPCPLGRDQWRECFAAIVDTYGSRVLVQGLRLAESIPQTGRQPWRHGELGAIADRIEQRRAAA